MQADLSNKVALVAGSTYGIGQAIAIKFAQNGADVVINGRNPESAKETLKEIESLGRRVIFEKADVTDYQQVQQMVDNTLAKLGKIDILVCSGGIGAGFEIGPHFFRQTDPGTYWGFVQSQWFSRLYCIKAVLEHMIERNKGKIVLITTDAGRWPTPAESLPGGVGAAIVMTTKVLAKEFTRWGIRINTISTTVTRDTPAMKRVLGEWSAAKVFQQALDKQPFPLLAKDIAEAALFFASDDSDAITGQTLSVNGGLSFPG